MRIVNYSAEFAVKQGLNRAKVPSATEHSPPSGTLRLPFG